MKLKKHLLILLSGLAWAACPAWSDTTKTPPKSPTGGEPADSEVTPDTETPDPVIEAQKATELATKFGITDQQVLDMRQTSKMGWGVIKNLLLIARSVSLNSANTATPLTMDQALTQVLADRAAGKGLGQIASSYNLKLGKLHHGDIKGTEDLETPDKLDKPEKVGRPDRADRPEKPGKPDKPEKPGKPDKPEKPERPGREK